MLLDELFIRPSDKEKGVVTQSNALYGQEDKVTYAA